MITQLKVSEVKTVAGGASAIEYSYIPVAVFTAIQNGENPGEAVMDLLNVGP